MVLAKSIPFSSFNNGWSIAVEEAAPLSPSPPFCIVNDKLATALVEVEEIDSTAACSKVAGGKGRQ